MLQSPYNVHVVIVRVLQRPCSYVSLSEKDQHDFLLVPEEQILCFWRYLKSAYFFGCSGYYQFGHFKQLIYIVKRFLKGGVISKQMSKERVCLIHLKDH